MTMSITDVEVRSRLEAVSTFLPAKGTDGGYSETLFLLSKTVHSFTYEPLGERGVRCRPLFAVYRGISFVARYLLHVTLYILGTFS